MDKIPDEILLQIFSSLSSKDLLRCSAVNHRWNRLSRDRSLWRVVDFSSTKIPLKTLGRFLRLGIQSLNLQLSTVEDPTSWNRIFFANNLRSLDLTMATISSRSLGQLLRSSSELLFLRLRGCEINHIAYKAISLNIKLKELDLSNCQRASALAYKNIFEGCISLEYVDLSDTDILYTNVDFIKSTSLRRLVIRNSQLEYLEVKDILRQCPNLTHMDISENFIGLVGERKLRKLLPNIIELINDQKAGFEEDEEDYLSDYGTDWEEEYEVEDGYMSEMDD